MSLKQFGGVFGRNPTFNDVTIEGDLTLNGNTFTGLDYQGTWNASTNTPALVSSTGTTGEFYIVSVAGATDLDGITNWAVGDWAMFNGAAWQRIEGGANGNFVDLSASGNVTLGDASTDTVTVNGYMGVGGAANSLVSQYIRGTHSGAGASIYANRVTQTIPSTATSSWSAFTNVNSTTAASAFTLNQAFGLDISDIAVGAGSTITNQYGVSIGNLTSATNNYGLLSAVTSGSNKWNIYASGSAANYFAGDVGIGASSPSGKLSVNLDGSTELVTLRSSSGRQLWAHEPGGNARPLTIKAQTLTYADDTSTRLTLDSSGGLITKPAANGHAVFNEDGVDADFRIESDTNTHAFFVDAGNSRVGVNASSPVRPVDIRGVNGVFGASSTVYIKDETSAAAGVGGGIAFAGNTNGTSGTATFAAVQGGKENGTTDNLQGMLSFFTSPSSGTPTERMRIKSTGQTRFVPLAADPAGAETGDVYYNSGTNKLRLYDGTSWVDLN